MKISAFVFAVVVFGSWSTMLEAQTPAASPLPTPAPTLSPLPVVTDDPMSKPIDPTSAPDTMDRDATDTPTQTPEVPHDTGSPAMAKRVRSLVAQMESGKYDYTHITAAFKAQLTPAARASIARDLKSLGRPTVVTFTSLTTTTTLRGVSKQYVYVVKWAAKTLVLTFALEGSGKLGGFDSLMTK